MPKFSAAGQPAQQNGPQGPDTTPTPEGTRAARPASPAGTSGRPVAERRKQFLISPLPGNGPMAAFAPAGAQALTLQGIEQALRGSPDIDIVRTVGMRDAAPMDPAGPAGVLVARMTDGRAQALQQQGGTQLLIERDQHLHLLDTAPRYPGFVAAVDARGGPRFDVTILVLGKEGAPLAGADVFLFGGMLPASARTDDAGLATLTVYGAAPNAISGMYVKPRAGYWSFHLRDPDLVTTEPNVIGLRALSDWPALQDFPARGAMGWGGRAMRFDQLPSGLRGQGVKVAVIDSGAAATHPSLKRIHAGIDIVGANADAWNEDMLGHGTHCAGVIAGADPAFGIRGIAPDAEIHVCKLFPGGQISQLIEALDYCIDRQVDVINLSLGAIGPSPALEARILRARRAGIACIAAAGNSGGPVQYPAASPHVLAVAAIGKIDEFPRDSYHTETVNPDVDAQGYFSAKFSCHGPQVDVCAPGVAVVSSVPPDGHAAWDGTSAAAAHVTGLAALMLAHHAAFQGAGRMRSPDRVERLFQLIRMSASRVSLADPTRIGYGLPDALAALGLTLAPGQQALQSMLGSLMGGVPIGDPAVAGYQAGLPPQRPLGGAAPFAFGLRPQGW
jgi:subtilisin family serine protease